GIPGERTRKPTASPQKSVFLLPGGSTARDVRGPAVQPAAGAWHIRARRGTAYSRLHHAGRIPGRVQRDPDDPAAADSGTAPLAALAAGRRVRGWCHGYRL